ncbi:hypothetical protein NDU88_004325 [Pleurodeles waltl]|uniref:Uncharacterized protein n=1 Tax=Pleurodeles waltl TaxID=8319 RepID=A0AAV7W820_PLEWA|nr:hypothetical protein NDU88_004325 [Pleurodeles waltl]
MPPIKSQRQSTTEIVSAVSPNDKIKDCKRLQQPRITQQTVTNKVRISSKMQKSVKKKKGEKHFYLKVQGPPPDTLTPAHTNQLRWFRGPQWMPQDAVQPLRFLRRMQPLTSCPGCSSPQASGHTGPPGAAA